MAERLLLAIAGLLVVLVVGLALFWHPAPPDRALPRAAGGGGDFTLQSADGPLVLGDYHGQVVLVYFGYTYCPDVCPTSLAATAAGLKLLTPAEQARVKVIFVSVDPERDTPARLKEYAAFFHPNIVGATGTAAALADIARRYGAFYAKQPAATAGGSYVVDHSSETYVVAPDGRLVGKLPHAAAPAQVAAEIRKHLQQQP